VTYDIYSTGDGAFLAEILNAVSMLMGSDSTTLIAMIGVLLGFVFVVLNSVAEGGRRLSMGGTVMAIAMYLVLFTPRVDVLVHDPYSWTARPVDNVPLGVAAAGMTLSSMGLVITEEFETAYSLPGMLDTGYGTPLEMLLSVRGSGLGTANSVAGHDNFLQTLTNYINDCTETGIMLGWNDPAAIVTAPDLWQAVKMTDTDYTTKTYLPSDPSGGAQRTCANAYSAITAQWGQRLNAWNNYLSDSYDVADARTVIQGGLDNLVGMGNHANQYMKNALVANVIRRVASGNYSESSFASTVITTQATEQSRVQFAAEASLFARFARPLMTFVEGFVYSIVPFMVFAIGFGMAGFKLIGRYALILMWVQLWMPIMSVTNLFISMAFVREMDSLNNMVTSTGDPLSPLSLLGMQTMQAEAADWIAVGGNLIAAAPALALTVLYGGAYTMVNLSSRMTPGDAVDEKQSSPDLFSNPGVLSMSAQNTHDPTMGTRTSGTEGWTPSLSMGEVANRQLTSTEQEMQAAQAAYATSVQQGISSMEKGGVSSTDLQQLGRNVTGSDANSYTRLVENAQEYAQANGFSNEQTERLTGAITMGASGSVGASFFGNGATASISGQSTAADALGESVEMSDQLREMLKESTSEQVQSSFTETVSRSAMNTEQEGWERVAQEQNQATFDESRQRMESASQAYSEAQQFQASVGANQEVDFLTMSKDIAANEEAFQNLTARMSTHDEMGAEWQNQTEKLSQSGSLGDPNIEANERQYMAMGALMTLGANLDNADARGMLMDMAYATGKVSEGAGPESVDYDAFQGASDNVWNDTANVKPEVNVATGAAEGNLEDLPERIDQVSQSTQGGVGEFDRDASDIREDHSNRTQGIDHLTGQAGEAAVEDAYARLKDSPEVSSAAYWDAYQSAWGRALGADENLDDPSESASGPASLQAKIIEASSSSDENQDQINEERENVANEMRDDARQNALAGGLTPAQAGMFAEAAATAHLSPNSEGMIGSDLSMTGMMDRFLAGEEEGATKDEVLESSGYREQLRNHHYDAIKAEYMEKFNGNEEKATEYANLTFDRIADAGTAGADNGMNYLGRLSTLNAAIGETPDRN